MVGAMVWKSSARGVGDKGVVRLPYFLVDEYFTLSSFIIINAM